MMNVLLAAATEAEIAPFLAHISVKWQKIADAEYRLGSHSLYICITGVGMVATTYSLTKLLACRRFDIAIQAGIGGSFNRDLAIGSLVQVVSEQFGDLGAEDRDDYLSIFDMGFADGDSHPYTSRRLNAPVSVLTKAIDISVATGITVNMVTGKQESVARLANAYGADVESMEGAAFHYVCIMEGVAFAQIRAISNYIEPRDRSKWNIKAAVTNLNDWLITLADSGLQVIDKA